MTLHVTITDLDTNEVLVDTDTNAIIAAYNGDTSVTAFTRMECDAEDLVSVAAAAHVHADKVLEDEPKALKKYAERVYKRFKKIDKAQTKNA